MLIRQKEMPLLLILEYAADGTAIATYGSRILTLDLGLRRPYTWKFIVARVQQPIIGADFLKHHRLLVDLRNRRIIEITEIRTIKYNYSIVNYNGR